MKRILLASTLAFMGTAKCLGESLAQGRENFRVLSADEMDAEADSHVNFRGAGGGYDGYGDEFLEFDGGRSSFADPITNSKTFQIIITNANGATRYAVLCPGLVATRQGLVVDGAFNDRDGNAGLTAASSSPGSIVMWNWFIQKHPSLIAGLKLATDSITQMDVNLTIVKESPFNSQESKIIPFGLFQSQQDFNTKILAVPQPFYMDEDSLITMPVLGSSQVSLTYIVSTSLNISKALRRKVDTGYSTVKLQGGAGGAKMLGQ